MGVFLRCRRSAQSSLALGFVVAIWPGLARGEGPSDPSPAWVGNSSCAATACHGGRREPLGLKGSESPFSEAYDPHVRAYSVLFGDRSLRIEKDYRRLANLESSRPFEDDACLRCHVHQGYDSKAIKSRTPEFTKADGAGCEGCHGPAGKWLIPHVAYGWKGLNERQKSDWFGMRPTKDLLARGQACAECHVGQGSSDVNHDLIAAGHPRLNFEYGSHLAKLPKHWRIEEDKARHPDHEAKVWVLGQLLSAKASLDLLESRASRSLANDFTTPWPEFAEYSCFACHHDLGKETWPSTDLSPKFRAGSLRWGTWSTPMTSLLVPIAPGVDLDQPESPLGSLRLEMSRTLPNASIVARRARAASDELGRLADSLNRGRIAPTEIRGMLEAALNNDNEEKPLDWDRAARQYLAIVAFDKALGELDPSRSTRPSRPRLEKLLKDLDFPREVEGRNGLFDSPGRWKLEQIKDDFGFLLDPPNQR